MFEKMEKLMLYPGPDLDQSQNLIGLCPKIYHSTKFSSYPSITF